MEFKFYCQHCGQHMAATDDRVGMQGVCPTCSRAFDIPAPDGFQPRRRSSPPPPPSANVETQTPQVSNIPPPLQKKQPSKNPFALVGAISAVLIILGIRGCFSGGSEANRITKVLNRCVEISRRAAQYNANPGVQANFVAAEFQKIDLSNCPQDFRMAFQAHIFAWQKAAPALANNSLGTNFLEGVLAGTTDDPRFIGQASGQAEMAVQQINATYYDVTQMAAHYGARIPNSAIGN
jgi:hypothetical protein